MAFLFPRRGETCRVDPFFYGKMVFWLCHHHQNEQSISFIIDKYAIEIGICLLVCNGTENDVIHFNTRNSVVFMCMCVVVVVVFVVRQHNLYASMSIINLRIYDVYSFSCVLCCWLVGWKGANSNQSKRLSFSTHVVTFATPEPLLKKSTPTHTHTPQM